MTPAPAPDAPAGDGYKCTALANTTAAVFMSALAGSIVLIAVPAIFKGIDLDPPAPATGARGLHAHRQLGQFPGLTAAAAPWQRGAPAVGAIARERRAE